MRVHSWLFLPEDRVYCIKEFAQMEVQETDPNECGVFTDAVYVNIPVQYGYACALGMAKSRHGTYHISYHWATPTGGSTCGVSAKNGSFRSQEEAFIGGLNLVLNYFKQDGLHTYITDAKREFFNHHHRQLSLFD